MKKDDMKYWFCSAIWMIYIRIFLFVCRKENKNDLDFPKEIRWKLPKFGVIVDDDDDLVKINEWCEKEFGYKPKVGVSLKRCLPTPNMKARTIIATLMNNIFESNDPIVYLKFKNEIHSVIFKIQWLSRNHSGGSFI